MIQDIAPHRYDNAYRPKHAEQDSIVLYYEKNVCLMRQSEAGIEFPTFGELERQDENIYNKATYLFSIDEKGFYLVTEINLESLPGYALASTQQFRTAEPRYLSFAGITGYQLYNWYQGHRYCGRCGSPTVQDTKERMLYCENCGNMEFPKICPAVIIGVTDGSRLLLSKYAGRSYKKYALLAGYTEIGETLEETVRREVMEEVGLKVKNIRYYKSQPWSFSDTLLMGFFCDLDGADSITLDEEELALAEWFEREELPAVSSLESLTNEMITAFQRKDV